MRALNIRVDNSKKHNKPVNNSYKNSFDNILDSNINIIMANIIYTNLDYQANTP